jgi:hypothetical protein
MVTSLKSVRSLTLALVCVAGLVAASCSTDKSPTEPSATTPAPAQPAPQPTPAPATTANVNVNIVPNPVPFSGAPITDVASCSGSANTWFYDQVFTETAGVSVHFTHRNDSFDGRVTNDGSADITVPAKGTFTLHSRWCSSQGVAHTAVTNFSGTDANGHPINASGGTVQLRSK